MALPLTAVPCSFTAGDTLDLVLSFPDHKAPNYLATLYFVAYGLTPINLPGAHYGTDYRFLLSGGSTGSWAPGTYDWSVFLNGPIQVTPSRGKITILQNPATFTAQTDNRSHARKTLDILQALIEGRAVSGIEAYSVDGRQVSKIPMKDLIALRDRYQGIVTSEENKAAGRSSLRHHKVQFTRT